MKILGPVPKVHLSWLHFLEVVFCIRNCMRRYEKKSEETKVIELRNTLMEMEPLLHLTPPPMPANFQPYWDLFA